VTVNLVDNKPAEVEVTSRGTIMIQGGAGTGYRVREDLIEKITVRKQTIRADGK